MTLASRHEPVSFSIRVGGIARYGLGMQIPALVVGELGGRPRISYNTTLWGVEGDGLFLWGNNWVRCEREVECKRGGHAWCCTPWWAWWCGRRGREIPFNPPTNLYNRFDIPQPVSIINYRRCRYEYTDCDGDLPLAA